MAFLTVAELADKYSATRRKMGDAVCLWIRSGDLVEPVHFTRRSVRGPREFNERVVVMLIVRDRSKKNCREMFIDGFDELMCTLKRLN